MSRNLDINRLSRDELSYEVTVRGLSVGTVAEMRKALRVAFNLEKLGQSLTVPTYPFSFEEDKAAVTQLIAEIEGLVETFEGNAHSKSFRKVETKTAHLMGRLDRCSAADEVQRTFKAEQLTKVLLLWDALNSKVVESAAVTPVELSISQLAGSEGSVSDGEEVSGAHIATASAPQSFKSIPVYKWNISFSGDGKGLSVNAFLERVEELCVSRHVSKQELFLSAGDLFTGCALIWYRAVKHSVSDWPTLAKLMREEFLPPHSNEKLLDEIKRRTQSRDEPVAIYLSIMQSLFNRLTCPVPELYQVDIMRRNLLPFFQTQLALTDIGSVDQLRRHCRQLEATRSSVEAYVPPPRRSTSMLEPDLAYVGLEQGISKLDLADSTPTGSVVCYNCNKPGHRAIGCGMPRKQFCFRCRKEGVTVKSCPNCRDSGNGQRRPQQADSRVSKRQ